MSRLNRLSSLLTFTSTWAIWCNGTPSKLGCNSVGARSAKIRAISAKQCKIGPRLLWRTNRKSHACFRLVPTSMTLDDLERLKRHSCRNIQNLWAHLKNFRPILSAAKCRPVIVVSKNIRCMRILRGSSSGRGRHIHIQETTENVPVLG